MARSKSLFKGCNTRSLDRINLWPFGEIGPDNVPALQDAIDDRVLHFEFVLSVRQSQVLHYGHIIESSMLLERCQRSQLIEGTSER